MTNERTPPGLNYVARQWRDFLEPIPFITTHELTSHQEGQHSLYVLHITLARDVDENTFYYVGRTDNPKRRVSEHKSEFKRCKTTTFVGKGELYDPQYMAGLQQVRLHMVVARGGLLLPEAKEGEMRLALDLTHEYGKFVLTRPGKIKLP
jgi:hypothetical protein